MKTISPISFLSCILFLFLSSCLHDVSVPPDSLEPNKDISLSDLDGISDLTLASKVNKIILYIEYEKGKEKIEVNQNQATLNFDNNEPRVIKVFSKEEMLNLKNFSAENNLLREVPALALNQGIKRIDVSHNRIEKLPVFHKNSSLLSLDLSYNKLPKVNRDLLLKMRLPKGATLDITKTGIPCKYVCEYIKRYPEVTVISDCGDCQATKK